MTEANMLSTTCESLTKGSIKLNPRTDAIITIIAIPFFLGMRWIKKLALT